MFHVPIFCYRFINWSDKFKKEILSQLELSPLKKNNRIQTDYDDKQNDPLYKGFVIGCIEDKLNEIATARSLPFDYQQRKDTTPPRSLAPLTRSNLKQFDVQQQKNLCLDGRREVLHDQDHRTLFEQ